MGDKPKYVGTSIVFRKGPVYKCHTCGGANIEPRCRVCEMRRKAGRCQACDRKAVRDGEWYTCGVCGERWRKES